MEHITRNKKPGRLFRDTGYVLRDQTGQTLIETIVAIFILVTALTTGLGLAIYALTTSRTTQAEIIASNLAREGVDVVRMMRDSNWLAGDAAGGAYAIGLCADLPANKQLCYPQAFVGPSYNISANGSYRLNFNNTNNTWTITLGASNYNMYLQSDGSFTHNVSGPAVFARKIVITSDTTSPYTAQNPKISVQSTVGWRGKKCTSMTNQDPSTTNCKVMVEEQLTNWKDYQ